MIIGWKLILRTCLGLAALSGPAFATTAYTAAGTTNMRSGPGMQFAIIAKVRGGSPVSVEGCLQDQSWCRASAQGIRGWISATRLERLHAQRPGMTPPTIAFDERRRRGIGRILGEVTDRPGYCYALDEAGDSIIVPCDGNEAREDPGAGDVGRILGEVTDRPGYCYALDASGDSVVVRCP